MIGNLAKILGVSCFDDTGDWIVQHNGICLSVAALSITGTDLWCNYSPITDGDYIPCGLHYPPMWHRACSSIQFELFFASGTQQAKLVQLWTDNDNQYTDNKSLRLVFVNCTHRCHLLLHLL